MPGRRNDREECVADRPIVQVAESRATLCAGFVDRTFGQHLCRRGGSIRATIWIRAATRSHGVRQPLPRQWSSGAGVDEDVVGGYVRRLCHGVEPKSDKSRVRSTPGADRHVNHLRRVARNRRIGCSALWLKLALHPVIPSRFRHELCCNRDYVISAVITDSDTCHTWLSED